jgi:catechol 2,3-dioxygenase-like lactoylglutathione lyase family enzyme
MNRSTILVLVTGLSMAAAAFCAEPPAPNAAADADANPMGLFIDHASIGVADIQKEAEWYQRVMGFKLGALGHRPEYDVMQMTVPGFRMDLLATKGSTRPAATMDNAKQGLIRVAFGTKDAEAAFKRLTAMGVQMDVSRNAQGKITSLHFNDPEGNALELSQR